MSRRSRRTTEDTDPMDLLLDTVSNVFGGVMFLTLLAALLIMTRGAASDKTVDSPMPQPTQRPRDARLVELEMQQTELAIKSQQMLLARLDDGGQTMDKSAQLIELKKAMARTREQDSKTSAELKTQKEKLKEQDSKQKEMEAEARKLAEQLAKDTDDVKKMRQSAQRTVQFRPLRRIMTGEATIVLRYGKYYLFQRAASANNFNQDDFFVIEKSDQSTAITPKPHRGELISEASVATLVDQLKLTFPPSRFHATIAVWDDSFAEFTQLRDGLVAGGYVYRTITADDSTVLSFGAVDSFGQ